MTFVIIGGGPTGVELAGIIPDVAKRALVEDFREIDTRRTRVVLVEGRPRLLPAFPERLSERTRRDLERLGVEVRLRSIVTRVEAGGVHVGDQRGVRLIIGAVRKEFQDAPAPAADAVLAPRW